MNERIRRQISYVAFAIISILSILFVYLAYIQVIRHDFWLVHSLNRRSALAASQIERGKIVDRNGEVLAQSLPDKPGGFIRDYPYHSIFAPVIGYDSVKYGRAGLEAAYNAELAGFRNPERQLGPVGRLMQATSGNSLFLTVDAKLQRQAFNLLGNRRGAIVVLDVKTGAILVSVSKPSFTPNAIEKEWNTISTSENSPLMNRAVAGLYPPGSIIKVMVADAALQKNLANNRQFVCEGELKIGTDYTLHESANAVHGKLNLEQALAVSCNVTFGSLAIELGRNQMTAMFERFGFSQAVEEVGEQQSRVPKLSQMGDGDLAQSGIGQSSLLTTPLKMATIAAAFANKGVIMKPYIVESIKSPNSIEVYRHKPTEWIKPTTPQTADKVAAMMKAVVERGTGRQARYSIPVAGKTGTAENPQGDSHSWFIGFAPINQPQVAIAVIVENAGSGGAVAAPLAGQILANAVR